MPRFRDFGRRALPVPGGPGQSHSAALVHKQAGLLWSAVIDRRFSGVFPDHQATSDSAQETVHEPVQPLGKAVMNHRTPNDGVGPWGSRGPCRHAPSSAVFRFQVGSEAKGGGSLFRAETRVAEVGNDLRVEGAGELAGVAQAQG